MGYINLTTLLLMDVMDKNKCYLLWGVLIWLPNDVLVISSGDDHGVQFCEPICANIFGCLTILADHPLHI
jgi:hypothetical protein